jgi:hypothetical protein
LQYLFNKNEHQFRENVRFSRSTNCFIYFEHSLSDFDNLFLFSLVFFHTCSIFFLLLSRQFMKIFRETRLWSLHRLISLICNKIVSNCCECERRRLLRLLRLLQCEYRFIRINQQIDRWFYNHRFYSFI